jgi:hypothetical protein
MQGLEDEQASKPGGKDRVRVEVEVGGLPVSVLLVRCLGRSGQSASAW